MPMMKASIRDAAFAWIERFQLQERLLDIEPDIRVCGLAAIGQGGLQIVQRQHRFASTALVGIAPTYKFEPRVAQGAGRDAEQLLAVFRRNRCLNELHQCVVDQFSRVGHMATLLTQPALCDSFELLIDQCCQPVARDLIAVVHTFRVLRQLDGMHANVSRSTMDTLGPVKTTLNKSALPRHMDVPLANQSRK
jgi:hypothetical protein